MRNLIDDAIEALRRMPDNVQEAAARAILDYDAGQDDDLRMIDESRSSGGVADNRPHLSMPFGA